MPLHHTDEELIEDLIQVAAKIGKSPTVEEYVEHGEYSDTTIRERFDGWNSAKTVAGLDKCDGSVSEKELLEDLKRVAAKLNKSPTFEEYLDHGWYGTTTFKRKFGGWNDALTAAGLIRNNGYTKETLLRDLRENTDKRVPLIRDFSESSVNFSSSVFIDRFGGVWPAAVRAGRVPRTDVPLSERDYDSYIQAAIEAERPATSIYGQLRGFTGIPGRALVNFSVDWVSRVESDVQPVLLTIPSEYLPDDSNWETILPSQYTTASGEKKPTGIKPLIQWVKENGGMYGAWDDGNGYIVNRLLDKIGIDTRVENLRASVAAHLIRRGRNQYEIEMQVGASKTDWRRSIEDYFLYLYQFEDYCHPEYEPSGTYLDPDTGDVTKIESERN